MSNIVLNDYADINKEEGFYDCFPIGNGHIGGMIYGNPLSEKVVLNDTTMWLYNKDIKRYPDNFYDKLKIVQSLLLNKKIDEAHKEAINLFPIEKKMGIYTCAGFLNIYLEKLSIFILFNTSFTFSLISFIFPFNALPSSKEFVYAKKIKNLLLFIKSLGP